MDDGKLIQLVRDNEFLYNKNHPKYKIRDIKISTWHKIANEVGMSYESCFRRWITLRDRYTKEWRRLKGAMEKDVKIKSLWHHFKTMEFLKDHIVTKPNQYVEYMVHKVDPSLIADINEPRIPSSTSWSAEEFLQQCQDLPLADADETTDAELNDPQRNSYIEGYDLQRNHLHVPSRSDASPTGSTSSTISTKRKKSIDDDIDNLYKIHPYKRIPLHIDKELNKSNEALDGFMQMIYATMITMSNEKKIKTMQKVTEIVMSIKLEPDS